MAGRRDPDCGGILALGDLVADPKHGAALEADLIAAGLRLRWMCDGTDRLNWRDLQVLVATAGRESRLFQALEPELSEWTTDTDLLAAILHTLQGANWQRAGGRGRKPKPIERPQSAQEAVETVEQVADGESGKWTTEPLPSDQMAEWLGWTA